MWPSKVREICQPMVGDATLLRPDKKGCGARKN